MWISCDFSVRAWTRGDPCVVGVQEIVGYRTDRVRLAVTWVFIVLSVGLLRLVFYWRPDWMVRCTGRVVVLQLADCVILTVWPAPRTSIHGSLPPSQLGIWSR